MSDLVSRPATVGEFERAVLEACMVISPSAHTRRAYLSDAQKWVDFCRGSQVDPPRAPAISVAAWVEEMRHEGLAPKTRGRRLSALSSIYGWLRRNQRGGVTANPFSVDEGPKREPTHAEEPTPIASAPLVAAAQAICDAEQGFDGARDAAILRILWATGARRSSLVEITRERLSRADDGYLCQVPAKGGKVIRLWVGGRAAAALTRWLNLLAVRGIDVGPVFRTARGRPMDERAVWRAVSRRGWQAGGRLSPHSFRVAFLTLNPAQLDELQDAAGHADPKTTVLYRRSWKGMAAFAAMPEVEDVVEGDGVQEKEK